jgi:hypothetical protein
VLGGGYYFGRNQFWSIVSYDSTTQTYAPEWRSKEYAVWISRIIVADTLPSQGLEIYVVLENGQVEVYDATERTLLSIFTTPAQGFTTAAIGDVDQDGVQELLLTTGAALYVYSAETQSLEWQIPLDIGLDTGLRDIAIGNVDNDPGLEIVTLRQVVDTTARAVQWDRSGDYDTDIALADIDADGKEELISARSGWNDIRAFDVDTQGQKWSIATYGTGIESIAVGDVDQDGIQEILCGSAQGVPLYAYSSLTQQVEWTIGVPYGVGGFTSLTIADPDSDGTRELLWGAGWLDTGTDRIFIVNGQNHAVEWYNDDLKGPFSAVGVGDIDGDDRQEIVTLPMISDGWNANGGIYVYDAATHRQKGQFGNLFMMNDHDPVIALAVADVDGNNKDDIVIGTTDSSDPYAGAIFVYDGATRALKWKTPLAGGTSFSAVTVADIDNDGQAEVIAGQRQLLSGGTTSVRVYDGKTGAEEWRTPALGTWEGVYNIVTSDLDGDGRQEIVFSTQIDQQGAFIGNRAYIYDGVTHTLDGTTSFTGVQVVASADVDDDGAQDLLIGTASGQLIAYDGKTAQQKWMATITNGPLLALSVKALEQASAPSIIATLTDRLVVLDGGTREIMWGSEFIGVPAGYGGQIIAGDLDSNRQIDFVVGGRSGVYAWEWMAEIAPMPPTPTLSQTRTETPMPSQTATATPSATQAPTQVPTVRPVHTPTPEARQEDYVFIPLIDSSKSSLLYRYSGN